MPGMRAETGRRILDAAEQRFADYGYGKTTMAEIAADCSMCVGNLYRFFENKSAIAAACVARLHRRKLRAGLAAAAKEAGAVAKLRAFLSERLRLAHAHVVGHRHLYELVRVIESEHAAMLDASENEVIAAMADLLQRGMAAGEVRRGDAHRMAFLVHQSLLRYNNPVSLKRNPPDRLHADLSDYLDLLYAGLNPHIA